VLFRSPTDTGKVDDTGPPDSPPEDSDSGVIIPDDETVDVVIIGGGPAGLAAGIEAWGAGAKAVILER
jgi:NADPH-dependent 2,4-dienoyl-CoA reductase/sulfur reductase-like enzyme